MASIDFFGIKEQIVAILKTDTVNLFSATPSDKTKFRLIEAGSPTPKNIFEPPLPRMWVTNDQPIATVEDIAVWTANASNGRNYDYRLQIIFVVEAKDGPDTEEDVDDFTKLIIEKLEGNLDLRDNGGAESTRVADSAKVIQIADLPNKFKGDRVIGRVIRFKVMVTA